MRIVNRLANYWVWFQIKFLGYREFPIEEYKNTIKKLAFPEKMKKSEAILEAIRKTSVGDDIILHNNDMSIWCILTIKCKEHEETRDEDGGIVK